SKGKADPLGNQAGAPSSHPALSADGRHVAFQTLAAFDSRDRNRASDIYLKDRAGGRLAWVSKGHHIRFDGQTYGAPINGESYAPSISAGGATVAYSSRSALLEQDTNAFSDVYHFDAFDDVEIPGAGLVDRLSETASHGPTDGESGMASISGDGKVVAYAPWPPTSSREIKTGFPTSSCISGCRGGPTLPRRERGWPGR
ncbi:MAG: TolB family protein, partial [Actinomycetota bacterium]